MPDTIDQNISGSGNAFSGSGDVHVTHHHYAPGTAPPPLSNKFDLSRLPRTGSALFGRDDELELIDQAWQDDGTNVLVLTAMGGAGKTALLRRWMGGGAVRMRCTLGRFICRDQARTSRHRRLNSLTARLPGSVMTAA